MRQIDLRPELATIRCPAVVAYGRSDRVRLLSHAHELAAGIPGSELVTCNSGHCSPLEDPGPVQEALAILAARISSRPGQPGR
jgi:3-oxoadipate enol-lactonase